MLIILCSCLVLVMLVLVFAVFLLLSVIFTSFIEVIDHSKPYWQVDLQKIQYWYQLTLAKLIYSFLVQVLAAIAQLRTLHFAISQTCQTWQSKIC